MNYLLINIIMFSIFLLLTINIIGSTIELVKEGSEKANYEKRLKSLTEIQSTKTKTSKNTISNITKPFITLFFPKLFNVLPSLRINNLQKLEEDLALAEWDDTFTPQTFIALDLILKIAGLICFFFMLVIKGPLKITFFIAGLMMMFYLNQSFKNDLEKKKTELFNGFPEFIRITSSFLSAQIPFVNAIENSKKYVNEAWEPILARFVDESSSLGVDQALINLRDSVDLFEVKEFVGLIRLSLQLGGNEEKGFAEQAEKISEMKKAKLLKEINKRKITVTLLNLPLLMCSIAIIALPMFKNIGLFFNL